MNFNLSGFICHVINPHSLTQHRQWDISNWDISNWDISNWDEEQHETQISNDTANEVAIRLGQTSELS